jgi:hypothetical protein
MKRAFLVLIASATLLIFPRLDHAQQPSHQPTPPSQEKPPTSQSPQNPGQQQEPQQGPTFRVPVNLMDVLLTVLDRNKLVPER